MVIGFTKILTIGQMVLHVIINARFAYISAIVMSMLSVLQDDLRKDCRLMEFNGIVNKFLRKDPESRKRYLYIRTYVSASLKTVCQPVVIWFKCVRSGRDCASNTATMSEEHLLFKHWDQPDCLFVSLSYSVRMELLVSFRVHIHVHVCFVT